MMILLPFLIGIFIHRTKAEIVLGLRQRGLHTDLAGMKAIFRFVLFCSGYGYLAHFFLAFMNVNI